MVEKAGELKIKILQKLTLLLLAHCISFMAGAQEGGKLVETVKVTKGAIDSHVFLIGVVHAKRETTLYAETSGTVEKVFIPGGVSAEKNQLLASLKNDTLRQSFELSKASSRLSQERLERLKSLKKAGFSSKAELEKIQRETLEAQIMAHKATHDLEKTQFVMPFKGVVGVYKIKEGSFVSTGDEVVTVYDPGDLLIDLHIPEEMLSSIKVGQGVVVAGEKGHITSVQKAIDPETHMGLARIDFSGKEGVIGASVTVDLLLAYKESVLTLPKETLFYHDDAPQVYVIRDHKAHLTKVKIGLENDDLSEIVDGLKEGDMIVSRGQIALYDGCSVKVHGS